MKIEKVIFDTNILFNKKASSFFGNRADLENFSKRAELFIPDMVIAELEEKYKRLFENEKLKFLKTVLDSFLNHDAEEIDIINEIKKLKSKETIKYKILELTNFSVLGEIKDLALKKLPPFECKDDNDKGFKDAYIYFTILEFFKNIDDKYIFVCTKDALLSEALKKHNNIKVIKDFSDFKNKSISEFYDEYFLNKLKEELKADIKKDNILDYWSNINGNIVIRVLVDNLIIRLEIENREIINKVNEMEYVVRVGGIDTVKGLITSGSYRNTHFMLEILMDCKDFLSDEEIIDVLKSVEGNSQIIPDEDVKQFINDIYQPKKDILDVELKNKIEIFLK